MIFKLLRRKEALDNFTFSWFESTFQSHVIMKQGHTSTEWQMLKFSSRSKSIKFLFLLMFLFHPKILPKYSSINLILAIKNNHRKIVIPLTFVQRNFFIVLSKTCHLCIRTFKYQITNETFFYFLSNVLIVVKKLSSLKNRDENFNWIPLIWSLTRLLRSL